ELAHKVWKRRLIADEHSQPVASRLQNDNVMPRGEITGFASDPVDKRKQRGHKLAKWNEVDFVVAARNRTIRSQQQRCIQRLMLVGISNSAEQKIAMALGDLCSYTTEFGIVVVIEWSRKFWPYHQWRDERVG